MENDLSQYLHLYGCSPVCVLKCRVRLADRGNIFPQYLHVYFCLALEVEVVKAAEVAETAEVGEAEVKQAGCHHCCHPLGPHMPV